MNSASKVRQASLLFGDILALYISLSIVVWLRSGTDFYNQLIYFHLWPFSIIFGLWLIIFYIAGLYDLKRLYNNFEAFKTLGLAVVVNTILSVAFFYTIRSFAIAPKTNLFIFVVLFLLIEVLWRQLFRGLVVSGEAPNRLALVGSGETAEKIFEAMRENRQLGYDAAVWFKNELSASGTDNLQKLILEKRINLLVIPRRLKKDEAMTKIFYELLSAGIRVWDLPKLYEEIFKKVPISELEETWFLENLIDQHRFYDSLKRAGEFLLALIVGIALVPLEILIAMLIKLTSSGPIIYKQRRVGEKGKEFYLYKFRTMIARAEKNGAQWASNNDRRVTPIGRFLRFSHLDELPQLINVIKGELSFVGPRPERPEFTKELSEKIPYYNIRHLIKPGITGWAQINYRYGASVEDAYEKLQYEIYYIKNRSLILDAAIILKTAKSLFVNQK